MRGPGSLNHNRRSFTAENVDPERSSLNVVYWDEPIQKVYHELFDEAVNRYNAKQKRKDRCMEGFRCRKDAADHWAYEGAGTNRR